MKTAYFVWPKRKDLESCKAWYIERDLPVPDHEIQFSFTLRSESVSAVDQIVEIANRPDFYRDSDHVLKWWMGHVRSTAEYLGQSADEWERVVNA